MKDQFMIPALITAVLLLITPPLRGQPQGTTGAMSLIPGARYEMGFDSTDIAYAREHLPERFAQNMTVTASLHTVRIDSFHLDHYEVTDSDFREFVFQNPRWHPNSLRQTLDNGDYLRHWNGVSYPDSLNRHPVTFVNWYAAYSYCQWKGKRLPTEAEWEYAASGGNPDAVYPWGTEPPAPDRANNYANNIDLPVDVGRYPPNPFGLYDMAGNVWEFLQDIWRPYEADSGVKVNPAPGSPTQLGNSHLDISTRRVIRGGSWGGAPVNLRNSYRDSHPPPGSGVHVGFRCAKSIR